MERSPIKKSWGEGVKIKKNLWARGLSNIEKHVGGGGGGVVKQKRPIYENAHIENARYFQVLL